MVTKVSRASAQILAFSMYDKTSRKVMNFSHLLGCDTDVSVNSKSDHPPGIPRASPAIRTFSLPVWVSVSRNFLCPGDPAFELEKFTTVLKENCENFSICFKEIGGGFLRQVFLCCFISIFAKTVDLCCIFNNMNYFLPFWSF